MDMDFEEFRAHLAGLLEFPAALIVEDENPSPPALDVLTRPLQVGELAELSEELEQGG